MEDTVFDQLIAPIVQNVRGCADDLLDLREAALTGKVPGACVACFFRVMGKAERHSAESTVIPLKGWLETNIEIIAENHKQQVLERQPLKLDNNDLESYCYSIMDVMINDRNYIDEQISLRFDFIGKKETCA